MHLTDAIKLVAAHTRENTDPSMDDHAAIECARTVSSGELTAVDDDTVRQAYHTVLDASADDVARALR